MNWNLTQGDGKPCENCAVAKAKQKNVPKAPNNKKAENPGDRIYLDIATIKKPKGNVKVNPRRNWCIMVDKKTQIKFSEFYEKKNDMVEPTCKKLRSGKNADLGVNYMRLDNAGENKLLQK